MALSQIGLARRRRVDVAHLPEKGFVGAPIYYSQAKTGMVCAPDRTGDLMILPLVLTSSILRVRYFYKISPNGPGWTSAYLDAYSK